MRLVAHTSFTLISPPLTSSVQLYVSGSTSSAEVRDELSESALKTEGERLSDKRSKGESWRECCMGPSSGLFLFLDNSLSKSLVKHKSSLRLAHVISG